MPLSSTDPQAPRPQHAVALISAGLAQCRFIVSEPNAPAMCCGASTDGGSWCEWHRGLVYERPRPKVGRPRPDFHASGGRRSSS
jgi:hypothetical protein